MKNSDALIFFNKNNMQKFTYSASGLIEHFLIIAIIVVLSKLLRK